MSIKAIHDIQALFWSNQWFQWTSKKLAVKVQHHKEISFKIHNTVLSIAVLQFCSHSINIAENSGSFCTFKILLRKSFFKQFFFFRKMKTPGLLEKCHSQLLAFSSHLKVLKIVQLSFFKNVSLR